MDDVYNHKAREFVRRYEAVDPVRVHGSWIPFLDNLNRGGLILDIGAGSGRDAAWLVDHPQKFEVFAVEPARRLRELAESNHPNPAIHWYADKLPQLKTIRKFNLKFDLILLSAVWMHLPEAQQERAFRVVSDLLKPKGIMVITFRNSVAGEKRRFHPVSANALRKFARNNALEEILHQSNADVMGRKQLHWTTLVFRLPDDGTGALPLLRNIVINDKKTSTYK